MSFNNKIDFQELTLYIEKSLPDFKITEIESRLLIDKEYKKKLNFLLLSKPVIDDIKLESRIQSIIKNVVIAEPIITEILWYQRSVFRYAAGLLLFGALSIGYWTNQAPQRAANDVLELSEFRGDVTGCYAHFANVLKDYNTNNDATKAIQSLKSKADPDTKCIALSKFYEAALLVKSKKYDEAKILLNQVITEAEDGSALENKAQKLLDTL